jgi:hypothetical protein
MRGGGQTAGTFEAATADAAAPTLDAEIAAEVAEAVAATIAAAEAEVAAAAAEAAAAAQSQEPAMAYADPAPLPACDVAAAIRSAFTLIFQAAEATEAGDFSDSLSETHLQNGVSLPATQSHGRRISAGVGDTDGSHLTPPVGPAAEAARAVRHSSNAVWVVSAGYVPLAAHCPLFARKFTRGVVNETLAMALSCAGVGLGGWCSQQHWLTLALSAMA